MTILDTLIFATTRRTRDRPTLQRTGNVVQPIVEFPDVLMSEMMPISTSWLTRRRRQMISIQRKCVYCRTWSSMMIPVVPLCSVETRLAFCRIARDTSLPQPPRNLHRNLPPHPKPPAWRPSASPSRPSPHPPSPAMRPVSADSQLPMWRR